MKPQHNYELVWTQDSMRSGRERVQKACLRCRVKKIKCSITSPCQQCQKDDHICRYARGVRSRARHSPQGYVDVLEQDKMILTAALQEAYRRMLEAQIWPTAPLAHHDGKAALRDIVQGLDIELEHVEKFQATGGVIGIGTRNGSFDNCPRLETDISLESPSSSFASSSPDSVEAPSSAFANFEVAQSEAVLASEIPGTVITSTPLPQSPRARKERSGSPAIPDEDLWNWFVQWPPDVT